MIAAASAPSANDTANPSSCRVRPMTRKQLAKAIHEQDLPQQRYGRLPAPLVMGEGQHHGGDDGIGADDLGEHGPSQFAAPVIAMVRPEATAIRTHRSHQGGGVFTASWRGRLINSTAATRAA